MAFYVSSVLRNCFASLKRSSSAARFLALALALAIAALFLLLRLPLLPLLLSSASPPFLSPVPVFLLANLIVFALFITSATTPSSSPEAVPAAAADSLLPSSTDNYYATTSTFLLKIPPSSPPLRKMHHRQHYPPYTKQQKPTLKMELIDPPSPPPPPHSLPAPRSTQLAIVPLPENDDPQPLANEHSCIKQQYLTLDTAAPAHVQSKHLVAASLPQSRMVRSKSDQRISDTPTAHKSAMRRSETMDSATLVLLANSLENSTHPLPVDNLSIDDANKVFSEFIARKLAKMKSESLECLN